MKMKTAKKCDICHKPLQGRKNATVAKIKPYRFKKYTTIHLCPSCTARVDQVIIGLYEKQTAKEIIEKWGNLDNQPWDVWEGQK